jgi:uncharacterized protein YjbJ (UPF0337 family)
MAGTTDTVMGRIKQAVGSLTGNRKRQRDGRREERAGHVKQRTDGAIDAVSDKVEGVTDTLHPTEKKE